MQKEFPPHLKGLGLKCQYIVDMKKFVSKINAKVLSCDIDGGSDVFIHGFDGHVEALSEKGQTAITADESNKVISSSFGLGQWELWQLPICGKSQGAVAFSEKLQRCSSLQSTVSVLCVPALRKAARLFFERSPSVNVSTSKKLMHPRPVKPLYDTIAPRFLNGNETKFYCVEQTEPYQRSHAARMTPAPKKGQLVVDLQNTRKPQFPPAFPHCLHHHPARLSTCRHNSAPSTGCVHTVKA